MKSRFGSLRKISSQVVFMFPGQGAQFIGMGSQLVKEFPSTQKLYDQASNIVGYDLLEICAQGPKDRLDSTEVAQVAIFVSSMAALEKLKLMNPSNFPQCSITLGLSLGEYSALCCANSITFNEGVRLTSIRGKAMQFASDLTPSGMVSVVGLPQNVIEELCLQIGNLQIGTYLTDKNFSVSGGKEALETFMKLARDHEPQKMTMLPVAGAFHSSLMSSALPDLQEALSQTPIRLPEVPVISNTLGRPYESEEEIRRELLRQVVEPVQWKRSMDLLLSSESEAGKRFEVAYEIGPGKVCAGILKTISRRAKVVSVSA